MYTLTKLSLLQILCVNNAGLDVGVSYDEVHEVFDPIGKVDEIIMLPKKPYAFVCYQDLDSAESAMNQLNGTNLPETSSRKQSATLYIFFVSKGINLSFTFKNGLYFMSYIVFAYVKANSHKISCSFLTCQVEKLHLPY